MVRTQPNVVIHMTDNTRAALSWWGPENVDWKLTPARITGIYLAFALGGMYLSDVLLPSVVTGALLEQLQLAKGILEIAATGTLLYLLTGYSLGSLREKNEHLDAAREELSVLHRLFRHNLRNDVTVVAGHADTLEDEVDRPRLEAHCDAIRDSCEDLLGYTEKAKLVADLNRDDVETTELDLVSMLDRIVERLEPLPADAEFETSVPDDATVLAHEYLEFTLLELVENAFVHGDAAAPTVTVTARDAPDCAGWLQVYVEDDGPGIPEGEREALYRGERPLQHGSGVGLWVARRIVLQSGGDFETENTGSGCRVTVTLPTPATTPERRAESALRQFLA